METVHWSPVFIPPPLFFPNKADFVQIPTPPPSRQVPGVGRGGGGELIPVPEINLIGLMVISLPLAVVGSEIGIQFNSDQ